MRLRSLSVTLLAGAVLVPLGAGPAAAGTPAPAPGRVTAVGGTYKTSQAKRLKRAHRAAPASAPVTAPATVTTGPGTAAGYADRVLALTNGERTSRGLRALAFSSCADGFANTWASALASAGALSHQPLAPILSACSARGVGENVAFGNVTPEALVRMWMESPGHRANVLNPAFTHLGVGDVTTSTGRVYAVQVFLTR